MPGKPTGTLRLRGVSDPGAASRRQGTAHVPVHGLRPSRSAENRPGLRLAQERTTAAEVSNAGLFSNPAAIRRLPGVVIRSLPSRSAIYPSRINRALCSGGITAGGSFTDVLPTVSREANSSRVSIFALTMVEYDRFS
jgi:hypothetical protein